MNPEILQKAQEWTTDKYDKQTQQEISLLINTENETELTDRFWQDLEFGTGGLRGIRGAGTNRMNIYNIRKVAQGLANYIHAQGGSKKGVVIGRDSRINSLEFAQEAASVLIENNITVYFFKDICPTPIVSYAIRQLEAQAGIMNTASHNPKEYNGIKIFWEDGAQVTPPHDINMIAEVRKIDSLDKVRSLHSFKDAIKSPLFHYCDNIINQYLQEAQTFTLDKKLCAASDIKILYSPLYGCGYKIAPKLLKKFGFKNVEIMSEQSIPDGNFPTVPFPNPEDPEAMRLGIEYAQTINADVFIATDPDADRIGVAYKNSTGTYTLLNGNQIGFLIANYLLQKAVPNSSFIVSTIVTSPLISKIAEEHKLFYTETLTGFKWIALEMEKQLQSGKKFLLGLEESHGYNISDKIRDKDGISATAIVAELVAYYKKQGKFLDQLLLEIDIKYGHYKESQYSITIPGKDGVEKINAIMDQLRTNPPQNISEFGLLKSTDYLNNNNTKLPASNVLVLSYDEKTRIIARPSGTEPKIKFYFSTHGEVACIHCVTEVEERHDILKSTFIQQLNL
ncbi:MAG: phospho-sugar mutase [Spirochaetota bacterium]|nr:phospho-sugar mutase [Spirochaetota bacterium]